MFKVEISSTDIRTREVTAQKSGQKFTFIEQDCYVHVVGQPYPVRSRVTLPRGQDKAYPVGFYRTSDNAVRVSPYGEITVKLNELQPLQSGK